GPLALTSPPTTEVGLTHRGPGSQPGEPQVYYPTGTRNFVRLAPSDDVQAAADVQLAQRLGLRRVFIAHDGFDPYGIAIAQAFGQAARRLPLGIAGVGQWPVPIGPTGVANPNLPAIAAFVRTVARAHPDGI